MTQVVTLKSSAGSGKTFSLTLQYLTILLADILGRDGAPCLPRNILALTFTNKAAAEMRSRIIEWMKGLILGIPVDGGRQDPLAAILAASGAAVDDETTARLRAAVSGRLSSLFEDLLKRFSDFSVTTIDSFVHLTLRASAFRLRLPPDFEITTESSGYFDIVLDGTLQRILEDDEVRRQFDRFVADYVVLEGDRAGWVARPFLKETMAFLWREESKVGTAFASAPDVPSLRRSARRLEDLVASLRRTIASSPGLKLHGSFIKALDRFSCPMGTDFTVSSFFRRPMMASSTTKGSERPDEGLEGLWEKIRGAMGDHAWGLAAAKFASYLDIYDTFKGSLVKELTYRRRLVLIEELNRLLRVLAGRDSFVPEIYYGLADRYSHFLLDEFQDTNNLQWDNIAVFAGEALSRGGTLFAVGDRKQSIYRWRGANADLVDDLVRQYGAFGPKEQTLTTNYRSGREIVRFNNLVFGRDSLRATAERILGTGSEGVARILHVYGDAVQDAAPHGDGQGYVRVERIEERGDGDETEDRFSRERRFAVIGARLDGLLRSILTGAAVRNSDVAVLLRRRDEMEFVVNLLLGMGIPVESDLTVDVRNHPLVAEVMALLGFLDAVDDDLSLAAFLQGEICSALAGRPGRDIRGWVEKVRLEEGRRPLYKLFQRDFEALWDEHFAYLVRYAGFLPVYELLLTTLKRCRVFENFPGDAPYLFHLCEMTRGPRDYGPNDLSAFVRFWRDRPSPDNGGSPDGEDQFLLKAVEGADAVKVMTIHKAKGLQFPIVILPFLKLTQFSQADGRDRNRHVAGDGPSVRLLYINRSLREYSPSLEAVFAERETEFLLDELNSVYVAMTRAKSELHIFLADSHRQKNHLIDHCFSIAELESNRRGAIIEWGRRDRPQGPEGALPWSGAAGGHGDSGVASGPWLPGRNVTWIERMKGKLADAAGLSRLRLEARRKGDLIHYILSLIESLEPGGSAGVREAMARGLARYPGAAKGEEVSAILGRLFANPVLSAFFKPEEGEKVMTEVEVVDGTGRTFKMDRVIVGPERVDVVDFKTGEMETEGHREQIERYGEILSALYPGKSIAMSLVYVDECRVVAL
jgi:ATP-dependent exoDNAse (exonuclease V) beta subunit